MTLENTKLIFAPKTEQYEKFTLSESDVNSDPILQFKKWYDEAVDAKIPLAECVTLATAELPSGKVSSRVVLFKELDYAGTGTGATAAETTDPQRTQHAGFVIFSNLKTSRKAHDIRSNPNASINFFWKELQRQVRVDGIIEYLSHDENQVYFSTRPRDSKIGAWASPQSQVIKDRSELDDMFKVQQEKFKHVNEIPCPPFWGGVRLLPLEIEFWQGRHGRLHDRIVFKRSSVSDPVWIIERLAS